MNYGFVELGSQSENLQLEPHMEAERYSIQLYHHVAGAVDLRDKEVLEIGCGRGGGAAYVYQYLNPRSLTGLDFSANAVEFCRQIHEGERLAFTEGDAEDLPFDDESFDTVINVESSHCYGSMDVFLREVARVLRPSGFFLFADFRHDGGFEHLQRHLGNGYLKLLEQRDISPNVLKALEIDGTGRKSRLDEVSPWWLKKSLRMYAGDQGSKTWDGLTTGKSRYLSAVLQKAATA
jgi:ubiquinone/menaquinone biosynthesis C-methylase UbiE